MFGSFALKSELAVNIFTGFYFIACPFSFFVVILPVISN